MYMLYLIYKKWCDLWCINASWCLPVIIYSAQLIVDQMLLYKITELLRQLSVCTWSYSFSLTYAGTSLHFRWWVQPTWSCSVTQNMTAVLLQHQRAALLRSPTPSKWDEQTSWTIRYGMRAFVFKYECSSAVEVRAPSTNCLAASAPIFQFAAVHC